MDKELLDKIDSLRQEYEVELDDSIRRLEEFFNSFQFKDSYANIVSLRKLSYLDFNKLILFLMTPHNFELKSKMVDEHQEYFKSPKTKSKLQYLLCYFNNADLEILTRKMAEKIRYDEFFDLVRKIQKTRHKYKLSFVAMDKMPDILYKKRPKMRIDLSFLKGIDANIMLRLIDYYEYLIDLRDEYLIQEYFSDLKLKYLLDFIYDRYNFILRERNAQRRNINRFNQRLDTLVKTLQIDGEICDYEDILKLCPTDELKGLVLDYIIKHNNSCYEKLVSNYESLKSHDDGELKYIFNRYGYNFDTIDIQEQEKIKLLCFLTIEEVLKWFKKYDFDLDLHSFSKISAEKMRIVEDLLVSGLLSEKFVSKHLNIIYDDNNLLSLIVENISLLNGARINIINYYNSLDVLLSEDVRHNLQILKDYGLNVNKDTTNIIFLKDKRLEPKIELIIEMGLFGSFNSLDTLNFSLEELYRKKVFKSLDIPIDVKIDFYQHEDFYMDTSEFVPLSVRALLNISSNRTIEFPLVLEKYKINNQVLFINGVYVSIIKLLNNLRKFEEINELNIYYAIIYGSYYTFIELEILRSELLESEEELVR